MAHPWDRFVFALITADAIACHKHLEIVARIEAAGYRIAYFELLRVAPEQLDELYDEQIKTVWEAYYYRLLDMLFLFGPTIGLIFEDTAGPPAGQDDAHRRLKLLKGATDPHEAAPGTIRRDLGGINKLLAFMHAADQPRTSVQEAGQVFSIPVSAERPPLGRADAGTDATAAHAVMELLASGPRETRGYLEVLAGYRARVLSAAWSDLSPKARAVATEAASRGTLAETGLGERLAEGIAGGPAHPAYRLLRAEWQPGLAAVPERHLIDGLAGLGLPADRWERLVLLTSAYFPPRMDKGR